MAENNDAIFLWDQDLDSILCKIGKLSGWRREAAYFILLRHILFLEGLTENEQRPAVDAVLSHLDSHITREKWRVYWGSLIPEPLGVLIMAGIMKLGLDIEPLMSRSTATFDSCPEFSQIDLNDGVIADIVIDAFDLAKEKFEDGYFLWMENYSIRGLMVAFSKQGNELMADLMLDKFRAVISPSQDESAKIKDWAWLLTELYENGCERIGAGVLAEFLPVLEAAAFSIPIPLLKLSRLLKKYDPAAAKRLQLPAKREVGSIIGADIGDKAFKSEFGWEREEFLREAAGELAKAGEIKRALAVARKIENKLYLKAHALSDIALALFRNGRKKLSAAIVSEALAAVDECPAKKEKDFDLDAISENLMSMKKTGEAIAVLEGIKDLFYKCSAMARIKAELLEKNEWERGEGLIRDAIRLAERSVVQNGLSTILVEISCYLVLHDFDDWALAIIRSIKRMNPIVIRTTAKLVLARSGAEKAFEFLEKSSNISIFSQSEPLEDLIDGVN